MLKAMPLHSISKLPYKMQCMELHAPSVVNVYYNGVFFQLYRDTTKGENWKRPLQRLLQFI